MGRRHMPTPQPDRRMPSRPRKSTGSGPAAARASTKTTGAKKKKRKRKGSSPQTRKPGRPSGYHEALGARICEAVATTTKSLATICKGRGNGRGFALSLDADGEGDFREQYARAKEAQAELMVEQLPKKYGNKLDVGRVFPAIADEDGVFRRNHRTAERFVRGPLAYSV